ncbi:hypothetical protein [Aliivibrio fischeri]|nr:hypothetical protein [Aliivibrio fischeri]
MKLKINQYGERERHILPHKKTKRISQEIEEYILDSGFNTFSINSVLKGI